MKLSFSVLLLAAAVAGQEDERGNGKGADKGPNFCVNSNKLEKENDSGGPNWKCKSRVKKNKGNSKKCKGKCPAGQDSTAPKKVRCEEGVGWMTKKQGLCNHAAVNAQCVSSFIFWEIIGKMLGYVRVSKFFLYRTEHFKILEH